MTNTITKQSSRKTTPIYGRSSKGTEMEHISKRYQEHVEQWLKPQPQRHHTRWINPSDSLNIDESDTIQLPPTPDVLEDVYLIWNSARAPHPPGPDPSRRCGPSCRPQQWPIDSGSKRLLESSLRRPPALGLR